MKLEKGRELAVELMSKHYVYPAFNFKFSRSKNTLGTCNFTDEYNKFVTLSSDFVKKSSQAKVEEVILHEIAHCLDYMIRGNSFHDDFWRRIAKEIGCSGDTVISVDY